MTEKELLDFCIENKGKTASGKLRNSLVPGKVVRGKIIAYTIVGGNNFILLEDAKGAEKLLPNPLPNVPYKLDGWFRLVSPAKKGFPCYAETVVIDEQVSDQPPSVVQSQAQQSMPRMCLHSECDIKWCHRAYAGLI